jgi:hypothetical protein
VKAVLAAKTDFSDRFGLLILRNLLKTQTGPKIPAYRFPRLVSMTLGRAAEIASWSRLSCRIKPARVNDFETGAHRI